MAVGQVISKVMGSAVGVGHVVRTVVVGTVVGTVVVTTVVGMTVGKVVSMVVGMAVGIVAPWVSSRAARRAADLRRLHGRQEWSWRPTAVIRDQEVASGRRRHDDRAARCLRRRPGCHATVPGFATAAPVIEYAPLLAEKVTGLPSMLFSARP